MTTQQDQQQARTETGGPTRTPRAEITAAIPAARREAVGMEPVVLLDLSGSMDWEAAQGAPEWNAATQSGGRRGIVIETLRGLVAALEGADSEAAKEQAGGSDEQGGLLAFGFASEATEIGDLNSSNLERKLNEIAWGGRTHVMPAWELALDDYEEEFGDRADRDKPVHLVLVITDGEADDWDEFVPVLQSANAHRVFVTAIVGYDEQGSSAHSKTLRAYQEAAATQAQADPHGRSYVKVISFDAVTDPREIAQDLVTLVS